MLKNGTENHANFSNFIFGWRQMAAGVVGQFPSLLLCPRSAPQHAYGSK